MSCVVIAIMIVLAAVAANDGIKFFLSCLAARSKFRSAESGSLRLLEVT